MKRHRDDGDFVSPGDYLDAFLRDLPKLPRQPDHAKEFGAVDVELDDLAPELPAWARAKTVPITPEADGRIPLSARRPGIGRAVRFK